MKFVIDMYLSPRWAEFLAGAGHEGAHWLTLGAPNAKDEIVLSTAAARGAVLLTHDLGFGRILALSRLAGPSTVLLRMARPIPGSDGELVARVVTAHQASLVAGCLLVVEPQRVRVQMLPMGG